MPLATTADAPLSIGKPTKANSQPIEVESLERVNNSSIGVGGSDVDPAERHWRAVCKIISYLNGTKKLGLVLSKGGGLKLSVYVDAAYADKANDRRSVSGVAVMLGGISVMASSTTQHCVTLSTSEAEYVAMAQGAKTALFTGAVLAFLQPQLVGRIIDLFEDNQGAIAMAENPISGDARSISTCGTTLSGS